MPNIILFGPPGSGKGTQSERLIKKYQLVSIAPGMLLREHIHKGTLFKSKIEQYINHGHLVPDELTITLVEEQIKENEGGRGFLFDGFPRTLAQARYLDEALPKWKQQIDHVMFLDVPEDVLLKRIKKRAVISGRLDDQDSEKVARRMQLYMDESLPIVSYYKEQRKLSILNGLESIDAIFKHIASIIDGLNNIN